MSEAEEVKLHIKVVVNKEKTKVLFAEAGSDFTDVLLSFLLLPLGKIVKVLEKHYGNKAPVIGSLNSLYNGLANLDIIHFDIDCFKEILLTSASRYESEARELRLNVNCTQPTSSKPGEPYVGVFTKSAASFIISDDLRLLPNVAGSIMKTLNSLGIAVMDMDGAETRDVAFGLNEVMALLKESLTSLNPLTALVFPRSRKNLAPEGHVLLHQIDQEVTSINSRKVILEVMLQKSTNKLVFAQADYDFIDFLFSVTGVALGKVEWFLCSNTGLKNIDNLHRSIADNSIDMHLKHSDIKNLLIKSTTPSDHGYFANSNEFYQLNFASWGATAYVKQERMYMVSDDLTVAPLGITSSLSVLNELKISLSDVEELELQVGLEEVFSIVKAALTSTTALTDGLIKPFLKKKAHQETQQLIGVEKRKQDQDLVLMDNFERCPRCYHGTPSTPVFPTPLLHETGSFSASGSNRDQNTHTEAEGSRSLQNSVNGESVLTQLLRFCFSMEKEKLITSEQLTILLLRCDEWAASCHDSWTTCLLDPTVPLQEKADILKGLILVETPTTALTNGPLLKEKDNQETEQQNGVEKASPPTLDPASIDCVDDQTSNKRPKLEC